MTGEISGHPVVDLVDKAPSGRSHGSMVCLRCGSQLESPGTTPCPAAGHLHTHELVSDPVDGLLYCRQCPLIAYDLDDVATEPLCPMPYGPTE
ncbi:hypothetical protein ACI2LF_13985 [Kribbella sp. NPDC020789]